jgi:hypothetical protein
LKIQVPEQGGADVDGEPVVDQLGGQQPAEVVRGEARGAEVRVCFGQPCAPAAEHDQDGAGRDDAADGSELALEQERHRLAHPALVLVVSLDEGDGPAVGGVAADDGGDDGDDGEQLSRHRNDALAVGLGRGDHQQRDDLAIGALLLADAEVGELEELLDPDAAVPQDLHGRPFPEGQFLIDGEVEDLVCGKVADPDAGLPAVTLAPFVACGPDTLVGTAVDGEGLVDRQRGGALEKLAEVVVAVFERAPREWAAAAGGGGSGRRCAPSCAAWRR